MQVVRGLSPQYLTKYLKSNCASNYQTRAASKNNLNELSFGTEN